MSPLQFRKTTGIAEEEAVSEKRKKQWSKKNTMVNVNIAMVALNKTPVKRQCRNTQKASTRGLQGKLKK